MMILSYVVERKDGMRPAFTATYPVKDSAHAKREVKRMKRRQKQVEYSNFLLETEDRKVICSL